MYLSVERKMSGKRTCKIDSIKHKWLTEMGALEEIFLRWCSMLLIRHSFWWDGRASCAHWGRLERLMWLKRVLTLTSCIRAGAASPCWPSPHLPPTSVLLGKRGWVWTLRTVVSLQKLKRTFYLSGAFGACLQDLLAVVPLRCWTHQC